MVVSKDSLMELIPATGAYVVVESGVLGVSDIVNIAILVLILVQLGYVVWKWRRDYTQDKSDQHSEECKTRPRKPVQPRREVLDE